MSAPEILHHKGLNRRGLMAIVAEGWAAILADGNGEDAVCPAWDQEVIAAIVDGKVVGIVTFTVSEWANYLWVHLSYVRPQYRRQGLFRTMFEKLTEIAQEREIPEICSGVSARNTAMQKVNVRLGRKIESLVYSFKVPQKHD